MKKKILILVVLALLVGYGAYYVSQQRTSVNAPTTSDMTTPAAKKSDAQLENEIKAGGNSYSDPRGVFTVLYPNDWQMDIDNNEQFVRFYKTGATQHGQTEMYDGIIVVIEPFTLQNQTLEQWVDKKIKDSTADGTLKVIEPKKSITINGYSGFTYRTQGLGESTYTILQKDKASKDAINISHMASDPQNLGYQKEVDALFATIELRK